MNRQIGFSDVDTSERAGELVAYLGRLSELLAGIRRKDYPRLGLGPGSSVLDVGCGAGEVCVELGGLVGTEGRVCGVDLSETMVEAARVAARNAGASIELRVASAYSLPFDDTSFDAVRAERVFQHLDDPDRALTEMQRVAKPGGRILVMDPDHSQHGISLETELHCRVHDASRAALMRMITNPRVGTRLLGMFRRAGLADVQQVVHVAEMGFSDYVHGTFLEERLASAVREGDVTEEEAREFLAGLTAQHEQGTFYANAVGYTVVGTRP
jgi:ubiquinone/menaquinone biosynthesis C-methylase UbiE